MIHLRVLALAVVLALSAPDVLLHGQTAATRPEQPRFRAGTNLVRVDAYVTADGAPVTDLTRDDFEVLEDNTPQRVESFELIRARPPAPEALRVEPNTVAESRSLAESPDARLFALFMDIWHVQLDGSHNAQGPITRLLDRVIGRDDLVGVMHPEMSARNMTLARKTGTIEGILKDHWYWGERNQITSPDPRDTNLVHCYPDRDEWAGIAQEVQERRREAKTLGSLEDLVVHLEGLRDERKFVLLLSEGWLRFRPDQRLARPLREPGAQVAGVPGGPEPIGVRDGRLTRDKDGDVYPWAACERERVLMSMVDHETRFNLLMQRANRANVTFYAIDPRGLTPFDEDLRLRRATVPSADRERLTARQDALHELSLNTDGVTVLNTNAIDKALARVVDDLGSYYLLGYYSSNPKLDGRFRKISVRVKRPGAQVRARPGYLAPTEAEAAAARVTALMNGAPPGHSDTPPEFRRSLDRLFPSRGPVPMRTHAAASVGRIHVTSELDAATLKLPEWAQGARGKVIIEHERRAIAPIEMTVTLAPGQRSFVVAPPEAQPLPPGKYDVRISLMPNAGAIPLQTTSEVTVPAEGALIGTGVLVSRRGPSTGLEYHMTADVRFRRTERIRLEVARLTPQGAVTARLLGRDGRALPVAVMIGERDDETSKQRVIVADLTLAPLAQGDYVIEVALEQDGRKELVTYGFQLVP